MKCWERAHAGWAMGTVHSAQLCSPTQRPHSGSLPMRHLTTCRHVSCDECHVWHPGCRASCLPGAAAYLRHETAASIWDCNCCRRPWAPSRSSCPTSSAAAGEAASTYHCTSRALQAPCGGLPELCGGAVLVVPLTCNSAG